MCMTRMDLFKEGEPISVAPIRGFPAIRDLVTDVSYNYVKARQVPPLRIKPPEPDGTYRMMQEDIDRIQEFHKCIECFLCQDVCHVIRDHEENKRAFAGPRFFIKLAGLDMHPLDTVDRTAYVKDAAGVGLCNITKCCTEVCPEHIHITDNGIIPLKERMADEFFDPVVWLLREFGVAVPRGEVADTPAQARAIAQRLGGTVVVKAQVHAGGRGKAGGIKLADNPTAAEQAAAQILGMMLKTPQTPPEGIKVRKVLVEEASAIDRELYLSITLDRTRATHVVMASQAGGMEIEEVAAKTPDKILREWAHPSLGLLDFQARRLAFGLGLAGEPFKQAAALIRNLFALYLAKDCSLVEINPLVVTKDGRVFALDAKLNFDDNALYRHKEIVELRDTNEETPLDVEASKYGLNYIKLDGDVGCMVNGAGLAMATMDIIKQAGGEPANCLGVGCGSSSEQIENAFRIVSSDPSVKAVFINVFGGILRVDRLAEGVIGAVKKLGLTLPVVLRAEGTNVEQGKKMLAESGLALTMAADMADGAKKAVAFARGAK